MKNIQRKQWIKFGIVLALYLLFLIWVKSWLGLLILPLLFDAYITKYIPWTFWKKSTNPLVKGIMGWVDAIVFALIAVYFVNTFVFQNYQIPSSSLEKTLLVGDYLYVSKVSYGPRVPNTPLSMPLTQHTMPITGSKSYIEWPQWSYKRVSGWGKIKRNDIVVFNFPAGDTVATHFQHTDFYSLAYEEGKKNYKPTTEWDSLSLYEQTKVYEQIYNLGSERIKQASSIYGKTIYRPVDRRENYVKRCLALPGDTFELKEGVVYINGVPQEAIEGVQFNYFVQTNGAIIPESIFEDLGISKDDQILLSPHSGWEQELAKIGLTTLDQHNRLAPIYHLPLTKKMHQSLAANKKLISKIVMEPELYGSVLYPLNKKHQWDRNNYGPLWIPKKGETIPLTYDNLPLYERCIVAYEGNSLEKREDGIYINGEKRESYTFTMDYFWMMGDNRHNSADSRYWGFVPEDHIVGKPIVVWLSLDKDKGWFDGKIRWNRFFKFVH